MIFPEAQVRRAYGAVKQPTCRRDVGAHHATNKNCLAGRVGVLAVVACEILRVEGVVRTRELAVHERNAVVRGVIAGLTKPYHYFSSERQILAYPEVGAFVIEGLDTIFVEPTPGAARDAW